MSLSFNFNYSATLLTNYTNRSNDMMDENDANSLFNIHEIWGIAISSIYFLLGFPTNLLSIVVCCKSLLHKFFRSNSSNKSIRIVNNNNNGENEQFLNKKASKTRRLELNNNNLNKNDSNRQILSAKRQTISRSNPHRKCFELYLVEISFCDLIILGYNFTEWLLLILSRFNMIDHIYAEPVLISKFMCKFVISLNRTVILMHNWLVASLAITRCYAIYKPINSTAYFSTKFYYRLNLSVVISLVLLFSSINIYGVMLLSYTTHDSRPSCRISNEIYQKYKYIDVYMNISLGIIGYSLPCIVTLIMNLILVFNIRHLQLQAKKNSTDERNSARNRSKFFKATSSLLMLSFGYIICYLPYSCMFLLLSLDFIKMNGNVIFVLTSLRYLNHTLNFYIYLATGKNFRNGVFNLLFGCKQK